MKIDPMRVNRNTNWSQQTANISNYLPMTAEESHAAARAVIRRLLAAQEQTVSLVMQIAIDVGSDILEERILPGHDLNSVELAHRYRTSRTPIREALMLLEKEALVDIQPRRRPRVKTFDKATIREIYRTRACLLELVAATVAEIASLEQLQRLSAVVDKMEKANRAGDVGGYLWANIEFHDLNLTLSGNSTAKRIIESLLLRTIPLRRKSLSSPGRMAVSLDDHRRLLKAYQDRDANLAAALIRSNHMAALQNIERLMTIGVVPSG